MMHLLFLKNMSLIKKMIILFIVLFVLLQDALKYVPIAWAAVLEGHITVKRGGGKDVRVKTIQSTKSQAAQLCKDGNPLWLVLFPEGT